MTTSLVTNSSGKVGHLWSAYQNLISVHVVMKESLVVLGANIRVFKYMGSWSRWCTVFWINSCHMLVRKPVWEASQPKKGNSARESMNKKERFFFCLVLDSGKGGSLFFMAYSSVSLSEQQGSSSITLASSSEGLGPRDSLSIQLVCSCLPWPVRWPVEVAKHCTFNTHNFTHFFSNEKWKAQALFQ